MSSAEPSPPAVARPSRADLCLVMPVHNEAGCIAQVIADWQGVIAPLGLDWRWIVIDDGSRDETGAILNHISQAIPGLRVIHQRQQGHGPAVMHGYHLATREAEWVLQIDGDGEVRGDRFAEFWRMRHDFDMLLGHRRGRQSVLARRLLTRGAARLLRAGFGSRIEDANIPFRLIHATALQWALEWLPRHSRIPNVLLTGLAARLRWRVGVLPIESHARLAGKSSLHYGRLARLAACAAWEACRLAWRLRQPMPAYRTPVTACELPGGAPDQLGELCARDPRA